MLHRLRLTLPLCVFALVTISTPAHATTIAAAGHNFTAVPGVPFTATVATFTDDNSAATPGDFTATINWGDATTSAGTISHPSSTFIVTGGHAYAGSGTFTVTVTISDVSPGTGTATVNDTATVSAAPPNPPTLTKAFGAGLVNPGDTTAVTFAIYNPNPVTTLTGVAFTDTLPAGLVISTPNGLTAMCVPEVMGVTPQVVTATSGTNLISFSNGTIAAGGTCTFSVNVTDLAFAGTLTNTTSTVTSDQAAAGAPATATIDVSPLFFLWFFAS